MRVLLVPTPIAGLTSAVAAEVLVQAWHAAAPADRITQLPLPASPGAVAEQAAAIPGTHVVMTNARDPWGVTVPATVVLRDDAGRQTAYVDGSDVIGAHLVPDPAAAALGGTTAGVADLILAAMDAGAHHVVVGLATGVALDGGAGVLAALGVEPAETLAGGVAGLAASTILAPESLQRARARLRGIEVEVATDLALPLLGFHGVAATTGQDLGLDPLQTQAVESALGVFVDVLTSMRGQRDLLTGRPRRLDKEAGAGAGGGAAHALLHLGGRLVSASSTITDLVGLSDHLRDADLVITTCERFDWDTVRVGVVKEIADAAGAIPVPVLVIATECVVGRREAMGAGLSGVFGLAERPDQLADVLSDPDAALGQRTSRLARTWSPRR